MVALGGVHLVVYVGFHEYVGDVYRQKAFLADYHHVSVPPVVLFVGIDYGFFVGNSN